MRDTRETNEGRAIGRRLRTNKNNFRMSGALWSARDAFNVPSTGHVLLTGLCRFCVETTAEKGEAPSLGLVVPLVKTLMLPKIFAKMQVQLKSEASPCVRNSRVPASLTAVPSTRKFST